MDTKYIGVIAVIAAVTAGAIGLGSSYASTNALPSFSITPADATTIAISHLGTAPSNLNEVDLDFEEGTYIYSVDFVIDGMDVSVEIDPMTGQVLTVEKELLGSPDNDDDDYDDD